MKTTNQCTCYKFMSSVYHLDFELNRTYFYYMTFMVSPIQTFLLWCAAVVTALNL